MKSKTQSNFSAARWLISFICMLVFGNNVSAQQTITSAAEFKTACETNPGNLVAINQSIKISDGNAVVNCGCTVVLANGVSLDFDRLNMTFAGPLVVKSAQKGELKFTNRSWFRASSITINLAGEGSSLATTESNLNALAGNLEITLGNDAKMELAELNFSGGSEVLSATGSVKISGGKKFTGSIEGKGSLFPIRASQSINIKMDGGEGILKIDKVVWWADQGSISIAATGPKSILELNNGFFSIRNAFTIRFEGTESLIKLNQVKLNTDEGGVSTGGLILEAGTGNASNGKIEVSGLGTRDGDIAFITMVASRNGQNGSVKVEQCNISAATGDLIIETGASGSTEVKDSRLVSATRIGIAAGPGGSCVSQANGIFAPLQELCSSNVTALAQNSSDIVDAEKQQTGKIIIFPNPGNNGMVNVSFGNLSEVVDVFVADINGRTIRQWRNFKNNTLLISDLAAGVYSLKIINPKSGKQSVEKFIIIGR
ncbi:MAG: T9SS type A sorting domain-containing protein [Lacibacter sp.]|nr:T9SS type A sorting domain-containing protein [Lacibacter sp.]